jgi:hypothetical protein
MNGAPMKGPSMKNIFKGIIASTTVLMSVLISTAFAENQGGNNNNQGGNYGAPGPVAGAGLPFLGLA